MPWNLLPLKNLSSYDMPWTSISLKKLYCCFEVLFMLGILPRTLDMGVFEESSLELNFSKRFLAENVLRVIGMFCICLILYSLSSKYFTESFEAFFTLKNPYNTDKKFFVPFNCLHSPWSNFSCKFSIIGLSSGQKFSCKFLSLHLSQEILILSCKVQLLKKDGTCF